METAPTLDAELLTVIQCLHTITVTCVRPKQEERMAQWAAAEEAAKKSQADANKDGLADGSAAPAGDSQSGSGSVHVLDVPVQAAAAQLS